jgi:hypothetical protein
VQGCCCSRADGFPLLCEAFRPIYARSHGSSTSVCYSLINAIECARNFFFPWRNSFVMTWSSSHPTKAPQLTGPSQKTVVLTVGRECHRVAALHAIFRFICFCPLAQGQHVEAQVALPQPIVDSTELAPPDPLRILQARQRK